MRLTTAILSLLLATGIPAPEVRLEGTLLLPQGTGEKPVPVSKYRVFVYNRQSRHWIGPAVTNDAGKFSFYDLKKGRYLLRIFRAANRRTQVWQQEIDVPATIPPIILSEE